MRASVHSTSLEVPLFRLTLGIAFGAFSTLPIDEWGLRADLLALHQALLLGLAARERDRSNLQVRLDALEQNTDVRTGAVAPRGGVARYRFWHNWPHPQG